MFCACAARDSHIHDRRLRTHYQRLRDMQGGILSGCSPATAKETALLTKCAPAKGHLCPEGAR